MMFGNSSEGMRTNPHNAPDSNPSSVNLEAILDNIGKLKESSQNLKPINSNGLSLCRAIF